ncbi:hypothetical protein ACM39_02590 [Chryseobacterium sp. FH2]|uniref:hypothetical protein n=1 Tax=Chryseobacterium sp. FH2 TaxID=1674291 RepID=UPI00065ACCB9|nr:hypothetical protein [Chryseobacterium sp. FH2]KMQ69946.1 hypothetical protein ACM39_02590 [Chryseobacterium sp. FH2]
MKDIIQALAATGDEIYAKICEVLEVDGENKTANLRPLDGTADILDAYLVTDDANGSMYLEPAKGSLVCVVFISKQIACVVNPSELKQFRIKIKNVEFQMDQDGFLLKKESETLKKLMGDLIKEIRMMKFTTNTGSTIQLVNDPQFSLIEDRFKKFLKD